MLLNILLYIFTLNFIIIFLMFKVQIFLSIASEVEPFLKLYQLDPPMLPFLAQDLMKMLKGLMSRYF